ncbi:VIR protein [Plasmodium vivax]|uniref:VIR protein n=1 Tax=Plasmodium vivax TaxID=5855 RepID=A0A1G4EE80_PLAVI|nr:VIR protein [Plasmodium vivax]
MEESSIFEGLKYYFKLDSVGLTSDSFYYKLNHDEKYLELYDSECDSLLSGKQHFTYKRLCKILLRFLKSSSKLSDKDDSTYDDCILFNYWMYNEVARRNKYDYRSKVVRAFGELQTMWNSLIDDPLNTSYYDKCKPDFNLPQQDDWEKRKELYDYCVDLEPIVKIANRYTNTCNDIYTYIKGKSHLYKYFNEPCLSKNGNQCPKFYSKCKDCHPDTMLPRLTCYGDMKEKEATAAKKALAEKQHPDILPGSTFASDGSQSQRENTPPLTKAGDVLLGVVATTMTSGALYKFTPIGRMLRNGFGWNNNMRNFNGGDNGLFDYASQSFNPFSGGAEEHYIGYHPA